MIFKALFILTVSSNVVSVATSVEDACAERLGKGPVVVWEVQDRGRKCAPVTAYSNWSRCWHDYSIRKVSCVKKTEERWVVEEIK